MNYYGSPGKTSRLILYHFRLLLLAARITSKALDPTLCTAKSEVSYSGDRGGERLSTGDTPGVRPRHCIPPIMAAQQQAYAPPDKFKGEGDSAR